MFAGRGLTRARDVLGRRGLVGDSIGLHLGLGAGWGTLTIKDVWDVIRRTYPRIRCPTSQLVEYLGKSQLYLKAS